MNLLSWLMSRWSKRAGAVFLYKRGMRKARRHDHQGAIDDYSKTMAIADVPLDLLAMVLYNRALVYIAVGDERKGRVDLDAILKMGSLVQNVKAMAKQKLVRITCRGKHLA